MINLKRIDNYLILFVFFLLSRALFYYANIQFDYSWVYKQWHLVDIELMRNKLFESIWYFHFQPPIFNLAVGLIAKLPESLAALITQLSFIMMTLLSGFMIFSILMQLNVPKIISTISVCYFFIMPEVILYENYLIQTWPVVFLLVTATWSLMKYLYKDKLIYAHLFFITIITLCLTRSAFHYIYFIAVSVIFYHVKDHDLKKYLKIISLPAVIFMIFILKNYYLFNVLGVSSSLGGSLWKIASKINVDQAKIRKEGNITNTFLIPAIQPVSKYGKEFKHVEYV